MKSAQSLVIDGMTVLVKFILKDGEELEPAIEASLVQLSSLIQNLLEGDDSEMPIVPLPTVDKPTFELVLQYFRLYATSPMHVIPKPITQSSLSDIVQEQYVDFIQALHYRDLIQLVEVANFLVVEPLLLLALARINFVLKASPLEEFKRLFIFHNDLTPEEEKVLRREYLDEVKKRNSHHFEGILNASRAAGGQGPAAGGLPQP